jgi:hypothetical protein
MRSMDVVVIDVNSQRALEMLGAHNQQPVQAFGTKGPNKAFRDSVRFRTLNRSPYDSGALRLEDGIKAVCELAIMIANQKSPIVWK